VTGPRDLAPLAREAAFWNERLAIGGRREKAGAPVSARPIENDSRPSTRHESLPHPIVEQVTVRADNIVVRTKPGVGKILSGDPIVLATDGCRAGR
jgi:hypothetical protein